MVNVLAKSNTVIKGLGEVFFLEKPSIVPVQDQITRQVSSKVKGKVISVTTPTIKMKEMMEEEMLIPMKVVAKTCTNLYN